MSQSIRRLSLVAAASAALALLVIAPVRSADASISQTLTALAAPLAQQFGVSTNAVTALFDKGISLESATQLLLVSQSAKQPIEDVTKLYDQSSQNIQKTAEQLKVDASVYSPENVQAAIDKAKADSAAAAQARANEEATKAANKAADEANKAVGNALGGFMK